MLFNRTKYWVVNAKKNKYNQTFNIKLNRLLCRKIQQQTGEVIWFPIGFILGKKTFVVYRMWRRSNINHKFLWFRLMFPFSFYVDKINYGGEEGALFLGRILSWVFLNRIKFTFMTMRILYMHVTMDLMHTIVYLDTLVIMDFMLVIHSSFYFLYDL